MSRVIFASFLILLLVVPSFADIWTNCGTAADDLKISNVAITPDPPVKGQNLSVELDGTLSTTITGGNLAISIKYGFITVIDKTVPFCSEEKCPVNAGPYTQKITEMLPSDAPSGKYTGKLTGTDQSGKEIACATFTVSL
eukprot:TRINITY_DN302_c0_g1_i4.p1 TRINITY_DN302_c0_g1~~TRINITY_DN302_c0_g1_i4.p1  ORF type:complete len:140 (-),score=56.26 TRINITY_DN302_c0_g1_i4:144-563(-)